MNTIAVARFLKLLPITTIIICIFLIAGCGPSPSPGTTPVKPNTPYALKAIALSESATLSWQIKLTDPTKVSGYNIYLADSPDSEGELFNSAPYPGDTDGDYTKETFPLPRLENGKRYYAYLRTVLSDGSLTAPSSTVSFLPLAQGEMTISQNYTTDRSGFNFAKEKYTKARDFENDIYIFATKVKSGISSPARLHSSLRDSKIMLGDGPYDQTQPLQKGKSYIVNTIDGGHAKLTLISIKGSAPSIEATFKYIYYPPGLEPK